jgi:hypothetical protein
MSYSAEAENILGWMRWDEQRERIQAKGYTSATAMLVADDEMTQADWIRLPEGWKRQG